MSSEIKRNQIVFARHGDRSITKENPAKRLREVAQDQLNKPVFPELNNPDKIKRGLSK